MSSTPDALWASRSVRILRPAAVEIHRLRASDPRTGSRLRGLDLSVPVGARLLLVSRPESAGSLVLRVLAGLVRAGGGRFMLAGIPDRGDHADAWDGRVGYVGPDPAIYRWLSPREALSTAARVAGLDRSSARQRIDAELDRFGLSAVAGRPMTRTSPMVVQKVAMAATLLARPEILLLDEPLRSVDADERRALLTVPGRRVTVLIASRYPASEAGVVNQVAFVRDGRLAMHCTVAELTAAGLPLTARAIEGLADSRSLPARARNGSSAAGR
jgi:ABC-2 type transport system ATP-binding protein